METCLAWLKPTWSTFLFRSAHQPDLAALQINFHRSKIDHGPKYAAKATQEFLMTNKLNVLQWLSQSPDPNPTEQLLRYCEGRTSIGSRFQADIICKGCLSNKNYLQWCYFVNAQNNKCHIFKKMFKIEGESMHFDLILCYFKLIVMMYWCQIIKPAKLCPDYYLY